MAFHDDVRKKRRGPKLLTQGMTRLARTRAGLIKERLDRYFAKNEGFCRIDKVGVK